ncbi:uncharacterized protein A1O9_13118 [Exophiala aquamarina CBS 119918]|uniref:HNH nuclease domain-containing protein n=1 Tax=Exophiala aquamarina CBS 119918 TaxID=1182545 RepID=A0A072NTA2_9EURO|nr:uncharacterized protein A1O9_13118 [Exophiala aquamarina CBS 119918]KEF50831.1 hypothetical protein A1O9_13118 [Exophiala aquamarina CBS 119918]
MSTPSPHHRHQTSLEGVFDLFLPHPGLSSEQRQHATRTFTTVIEACEPLQNHKPYKQVTLVRLTYEYARSEASRDNFLRFFFEHTQIPVNAPQSESISTIDHAPRLITFAETLMENFFLPLRASTRKTPQPSPAALSDLQSMQSFSGTTQRLATLRRDCLIRDRHRCVISRSFDRDEAMRRVARDGTQKAQDDDGFPLSNESNIFATLEVAHIIPHSLMTLSSGEHELDTSKRTALAILNMFDDGVVRLIEGNDIDRTRNAITLTMEFHQLFGRFEVYFEPQGNQLHTYRIDSVREDFMRHPILPIESRSLFLTDTRTIDPPSPRLLAIHAAIAHILYLSAAGSHIDCILDDLDHGDILVDGSTQLGYLTTLRVGGWWDGRIGAY